MAHTFDILHFHLSYLPFPTFSQLVVPFGTTLHERLDLPELQPLFAMFPQAPVVSISDSERVPLPAANRLDTVYHGLPDGGSTGCPVRKSARRSCAAEPRGPWLSTTRITRGPPLRRSAMARQSLDGRHNAQLLGEHALIDAEVQVDFLLTDRRHSDVDLFRP